MLVVSPGKSDGSKVLATHLYYPQYVGHIGIDLDNFASIE